MRIAGQFCFLTLLFFLLGMAPVFSQETHTLSGNITDSSNGEALIGATVKVKGTGTGASANNYGYYSLTLPEGEYVLIYSYMGKEKKEEYVELDEDKKVDIELADRERSTDVVEIKGEREDENVSSIDMSTQELDMEQMEKLPAFLGEVDVLKTVQRLPGVQSGGEGSTGFHVRGGAADQNLILLDEAIVYNASHFFNFFSVFNPDAVKDVQMYKGGIPPRYGGRLSSVLDIRMKEGNKKEFGVSGGIGTISSRLTAEGPIKKDKGSFLVTGRRTYADMFLYFSPEENASDNKLYFYDLNLKANYEFSETDKLYLSGYFGRDVTGFADVFGFDWGNGTGTLRWNHLFNDKLFANFSYIYSRYSFNITGDVGPQSFDWDSWINDHNLKGDFTYYMNSKNTMRFGFESIYHNIDPGVIEAEVDGSTAFREELSQKNGLEHALYLSNEQEFTSRLSGKYGLRASAFQRIGPGKRYELNKEDNLEYRTVDTTDIPDWKTDTAFYNLEPRVSFRYRLDSVSSVKASYNRMVQYIQRTRSSTSGAPFDVWYTANNNVPPQTADQVAIGYFRNFMDNRIEGSLELYYKDIGELTDYVDNADVLGNETFETELRLGNGWSYGAEVMLEKSRGDLTGWFSYTWSRTERETKSVNGGEPYFAPFDRRHDLGLTMAYDLTDRLTVSTNFSYKTGRAVTLPIARYRFQGSTAPYFPERNSNRLPDYHRMDFAITLGPKDEEDKGFKSSWSLSVYNVYARKNPISVSFTEDDQGNPETEMFYIPGPLPALTWNFNF